MPPFERVSDLTFSVRVEGQENRAAGITGRSSRRGSLALFGIQFRRELEDERVRQTGQLGEQRQVITTEAVGVVVVGLKVRRRNARCRPVLKS